jgi:hypothetical protein
VGYDFGQVTRPVAELDWQDHPQVERLAATAGKQRHAALAVLPQVRDVETPWPLAVDVFDHSTLIEFRNRTKRAFPGFDELDPLAQGLLVSVVYNRGTSMRGDKRREMLRIRDVCVPAKDYQCMATQLRSMIRLWRGLSIERGMARRYEETAHLMESIN